MISLDFLNGLKQKANVELEVNKISRAGGDLTMRIMEIEFSDKNNQTFPCLFARKFVQTIVVPQEDTKGATRKVHPQPKFQQGKKESEQAFFNRMERETQKVLNQVKFEEKFQVSSE